MNDATVTVLGGIGGILVSETFRTVRARLQHAESRDEYTSNLLGGIRKRLDDIERDILGLQYGIANVADLNHSVTQMRETIAALEAVIQLLEPRLRGVKR